MHYFIKSTIIIFIFDSGLWLCSIIYNIYIDTSDIFIIIKCLDIIHRIIIVYAYISVMFSCVCATRGSLLCVCVCVWKISFYICCGKFSFNNTMHNIMVYWYIGTICNIAMGKFVYCYFFFVYFYFILWKCENIIYYFDQSLLFNYIHGNC